MKTQNKNTKPMKKLLLVFLFFTGLVNAQIVNIPDTNFKAKLLSASSSNQIASIQTPNIVGYVTTYNSIDSNNNGEIEQNEASAIKYLNIQTSSINDLTGIEFFINLISLNCYDNQLSSINLTLNPNLEYLSCGNNQLTALDVSQNPNLSKLYCAQNLLTSLNITNLPNLKNLDFKNNQLSTINLTNNINLTSINAINNNLTSLDVSGFNNLQFLNCSLNSIATLNLTGANSLSYLNCKNNQITNLDATSLTSIVELDCSYNGMSSMNISGLSTLSKLNCNNNSLTNINFNGLTNLENFNGLGNLLTTVNINGLTNLKFLTVSNNQLSSINISGTTQISLIDCKYNNLVSLNLTGLNSLKNLYCNNNQLININITGLTNLESLYCQNNQLNNLNCNGLTNLKVLNASYNTLTTMDLTGLNNLTTLECGDNLLNSLNLSGLVNLEDLICGINQLTTLDASGLNSLLTLTCYANQLTNLNVNGLTNLILLQCDNNQLTDLDLSTLSSLETFSCSLNNLTTFNLKNGSLENFVNFSDNPNLTHICCDSGQIIQIQNLINQNSLTNCVTNSYCSFTPGGNFNTITGSITYDANTNGCDALDLPQNNIRIDINDGTNQGASFTDDDGEYNFYTDSGSFNITPNLENPTWFSINPTTATIPFTNNNNNVTTQNFCITPNGIHNDLEVIIMPVGVARPGFDAHYKIVYKNKGNQSLSGNIAFTYDDAILDFVSSSITPNNLSTGSITWNYNNLLPFENRNIDVTLNVNSPTETPAVNNGDILNYSTTINLVTADESPNDNIFTYNQTVVGSYDPNSVECLEGETVSPSLIGEYLHYAINFENLGTYQAENVVVKDIIDASKYDVNTLQMLNTSHEVYTKLTGNDIEFIFEGINLAAASGNPPVGGHGTILFKIKSKPNLVTNDFVTKTADIYFDYNFPIATNIETTTFAALSNSIFTIDESVVVSPNPTNGIVNIESKSNIKSIELYDVQGRILQTIVENNMTSKIDISTKENGIYFLKINTDYGSKAVKIMKE